MKLNKRNLEAALPLLAVEKNCMLSKMADITVGFRVQLPEIFTLSGEEYTELHGAWVRAIKLLPTGTMIHKQDWFTEEKYQPDTEQSEDFLAQAYERHFIERPYLNHHCYLYVSKLPKARQKQKSNKHSLTKRWLVPKEQMAEKELRAFFDAVSQFQRIMQDSNIKMNRLTDDELVSVKGDKGIIPNYFRLQPNGNKKVILEDWDLDDGHVRIGSKEVLCFTLSDADSLPLDVETTAAYNPLSTEGYPFMVGNVLPVGLMLSCNHIYNQYICLDDQQAALKEFEVASRNMKSLSKFSTENAINQQWTDEYILEAKQSHRRLCRSHFNVMVWTEKPEHLDVLRSQTASAIAQLDCSPKQNTQDAARLLWAGIPGNAGDLPFDETFYTFVEQSVCFFNMESTYHSSDSPSGIRLCDRFGKPVRVDLSEEPLRKKWITNRNKFVLGTTGSGKSFFMNGVVRQYYEQLSHVLLIDVGNSYEGTCNLINRQTKGEDGIYLTHEDENPIRFNPFYVADNLFTTDKIKLINSLLQTLWKKDSEDTSRTEETGLAHAVDQYLDRIKTKKTLNPCFDDFYEYINDVNGFRGFMKDKGYTDAYFDVQQFVLTLQPFYKGGKYDYLLNSNLKVDLLDKRFIVFELFNIQDHPVLFPIVTLIIMETFVAKISRLPLSVRKQIVIEEAWKAIMTPHMATYIKNLSKTIRKYFGEIVVVTQEANDIANNPIVQNTIISQSDCKILLNSPGKQVDNKLMQSLIGLTEKQMQLYLSVNKDNDPRRNYKEVFIALGPYAKVYATEVSLEEYGAYTTEGAEKEEVQQLMATNGGNINVALTDFADHKRSKLQTA